MKLFEFFGNNINHDKKEKKSIGDFDDNELFFSFLENDTLYKKYYFSIEEKIKNKKFDESLIIQEFMPMVKQGCREFYSKKRMFGKLGKLFPKDLREEMCKKLYDHYFENRK